MNSSFLLDDIKRDEGCELEAYPDPLSGGAPWTVGFGCTGPGIEKGTVWTQEKAESELRSRVKVIQCALLDALPWFQRLDDFRQDVLVNMAYQMGVKGLLKFKATLSAVQAGEWDHASAQMLSSAWASQTPKRAQHLAAQMRTGTHQGE